MNLRAVYLGFFRIFIAKKAAFNVTANYCERTTAKQNKKHSIHIFHIQRLGIAGTIILGENSIQLERIGMKTGKKNVHVHANGSFSFIRSGFEDQIGWKS